MCTVRVFFIVFVKAVGGISTCTYFEVQLQVRLSKVKTYFAKTYFKNILKDGFIDPN